VREAAIWPRFGQAGVTRAKAADDEGTA
jgi:hypothetical protein